MTTQQVYTNDPTKGRVRAGEFAPDTGVFVKYITKASQRFHQYKGYAVQADVMEELKKRDAKTIRMYIKYGKHNYALSASIETWDEYGKVVSFGHGDQIVLAEDRMTRKEMNVQKG